MIDVDRLLDQIDLVTLAERAGVHLRDYGSEYRGKCPFHRGENPTAFVVYHDGERQRWHSYTEDTGGDALEFVEQLYHVDFLEAARILADEANIDLPGLSTEEARTYRAKRAKRKADQEIMRTAAGYYREALTATTEATDYAAERFGKSSLPGLLDTGVLGYSDGRLRAHLEQGGYDLKQAAALGLLSEHSNGRVAYVDTIPSGYLVYIHRRHRDVTYFAGRSIESDDPQRKSRNISAPRRPLWMIQKRNAPLLVVEGQACALTAWIWGYNAIALAGKSGLDSREAERIRRYDGVYLCLDDDTTYHDRAKIADQLGPLCMIARLPWHDLNEGLTDHNASREEMAQVLDSAIPWVGVAVDYASTVPPFRVEEELGHLARLVAGLPQGTRGKYLHEICTKRKLTTRGEFKNLISEYTEEQSETNGYEIIDGKLSRYGDPLCNFSAVITHELTQDDGLNPPTVSFNVTGTLETGEPLPPLELDATEFTGMKWIHKSWGARPILYTSPSKSYELQRAIQEVSKFDLKRERVHTFTGWCDIDNQHRYLTTSGAIGAGGLDPDTRVDLGINNLRHYALPEPPADPRPALQSSLAFLDLGPLSVTAPIWLAMYAAPLGPFQTLDAVLWVYGTTQSGKSTLSHLALTHYGSTFINGHKYRAPIDWISTVTAIEGALFSVKDAPIVIDDYAPQNGSAADARNLSRSAQRTIRAVGNRSARSRFTSNMEERENRPPRGLVISTAENPLIGQSTVGRMIYVPIEPGDVITPQAREETALDVAQRHGESGRYAGAMATWLTWIAGNWEHLERNFPERVEEESRVGRISFPSGQSRLADYYALFSVTARYVHKMLIEYGVMDEAEAKAHLFQVRSTIIDLLSSQGARVSSESPVSKFWTAIGDLLAQKRVHIAPKSDISYMPPDRSTMIGWYDEEHIYLLTNAALTEAKEYWEALDERLDILSDAFRRMLNQQGYVADRASSQFEKKTYINTDVSGRPRTLWLSRDEVTQRAGVVVGNDAPEG
jgi:hypothetical protein